MRRLISTLSCFTSESFSTTRGEIKIKSSVLADASLLLLNKDPTSGISIRKERQYVLTSHYLLSASTRLIPQIYSNS